MLHSCSDMETLSIKGLTEFLSVIGTLQICDDGGDVGMHSFSGSAVSNDVCSCPREFAVNEPCKYLSKQV